MAQATWKRSPRPPLAPKVVRVAREAGLYLLVAIAAFLLLALWTYSPQDPGWSHSGSGGVIHNRGGHAGAWLADAALTLFGFVSYAFPIMAAVALWRRFLSGDQAVARDARETALLVAGVVGTVVGAAGLAHLHFATTGASIPSGAGGVLGALIGRGFVAGFSFVGATLFLLALFLAGVTLYTGLSWLRVMDAVGHWTLEAIARARVLGAEWYDRWQGHKARKERQQVVAEDKKVLEQHPPPRIEPVLKPIPKSERVEREKQAPLFEVPASGDLPPLNLLDSPEERKETVSKDALENTSRLLEKKLLDFGIEAHVVAVHPGPVITRFEIDPAPGIKASQITNLARDLARALSVVSLRVVENIPGKAYVGLEMPNESRETVRLNEILSSEAYEAAHTPVALALGKDISGEAVVTDLARMPHMLIAGTTGSGKSVCINALVLSLVYKSTPEQVRLILVDPKMLELAVYEGIPHLLAPVVTDMKEAANALRWCIFEMERRYRLMAALGVRNLAGYNQKVKEAEKDKKPLRDPLAPVIEGEEVPELKTLPTIVILIDELADLMMVTGKKVEELIVRLAQKARAAGLHLVLATQRPSVDVVTGLIKANIPARIAFQMSSRVDSRTVLDQMGAEQLLGHGDMLFLPPGVGGPQRVHGAFVSDDEVHRVVRFLKKSGPPAYDNRILEEPDAGGGGVAGLNGDGEEGGENDPLYDEALKIVTETRRASISGVQRRLRIGYNRAARLIEEMERSGVVGPMQGNGNREVLAPPPPRD